MPLTDLGCNACAGPDGLFLNADGEDAEGAVGSGVVAYCG
jgi:hypothetical protein